MLRAEAHDSAVNFAGAANNAYARFLGHDNTGLQGFGSVFLRALLGMLGAGDMERLLRSSGEYPTVSSYWAPRLTVYVSVT